MYGHYYLGVALSLLHDIIALYYTSTCSFYTALVMHVHVLLSNIIHACVHKMFQGVKLHVHVHVCIIILDKHPWGAGEIV